MEGLISERPVTRIKKSASKQAVAVQMKYILHWLVFDSFQGSIYVSEKLTTYPSPKCLFCLNWEVSVNVSLGEG